MDRRPLPPLLPNSNPKRAHGTAHAENLGRNKITRVGTACESCKRRRSKCSGLPAPCKLCLQTDVECTFDPSLDGRRAWHREDREALTLQNKLLTSLVDVIRFGSVSQVDTVVRSIREDETSRDIILTVQDCLQQLEEDGQGRSPAPGIQSEYQQQAHHYLVEESDKDDGADSPGLRRDITGDEPFDHAIGVSDRRPGIHDRQPKTRPSDTWNFCPTCNQPRVILVDAVTPPESFEDYQGLTQMNDSCTQDMNSQTGGTPQPGTGPPSIPPKSRSRRQSDVSEIQKNRQGWHFSLQAPEMPSAYPAEAVASVQTEGDRASEQDTAVAITGQSPSQDTPYAEIVSSLSRTTLGTLDGLSLSHQHISPLYGIQTLSVQEETPLSRIITGYRDGARNLIAYGADPASILGPDIIDVELFFHDRLSGDPFTVCSWACEVWRSFDDWNIYVRLAHILAYSVVMRWMLVPSWRSYAAIPDILKPRPIQYLVPHHIALDFLPLPPLREALIKNLRDWMSALPSANLSVNWTRSLEEAVVWDEQHQRRRLSQAFMEHVTFYQSWSIDESILATFPEIKGMIRTNRA